MQAGPQTAASSKTGVWAGRVVSVIPAVILLFGGSMKLLQLPSVLQGFAQYGYPAGTILAIGVLEIGSAIIYLIPRTAVLGAILISGLLGGAIASNVRISNHLYFIPLILGVLVWAGLYLRDPRLRDLIPLRNPPEKPESLGRA